MTDVLVIVDMQAEYPAAHDGELCEEIRVALRRTWKGVVEVRFQNSGGSTLFSRDVSIPVIWKDRNGGGDELYAYLVGANLIERGTTYYFAGVNRAACVEQTACGLAKRLDEVHGITEACSIVWNLTADKNRWLRIIPELPEP